MLLIIVKYQDFSASHFNWFNENDVIEKRYNI